eukprot:249837-Pleurochrysis_carterae.AAC.1
MSECELCSSSVFDQHTSRMNTSGKRKWQSTMHHDARKRMRPEMCGEYAENDEKLLSASWPLALDDHHAAAWRKMLQKVGNFIREGGGRQRKPSDRSEDAQEKRLARWVRYQQQNYRDGTNIMKDITIREEWASFLEEHNSIFEADAAAWRNRFQELVEFLEKRRERGEGRGGLSRRSKDVEEKRLATWIAEQQRKYAKNVGIMKKMEIREVWAAFVHGNAALFQDHKAAWRN